MKKNREKCFYCQKRAVPAGTDEPCELCRREHLRTAERIKAARPIEPSNMMTYRPAPKVVSTKGLRLTGDW